MVAATEMWATALQQLAALPATYERTSPSEAVVPGIEVVPLPVLDQFVTLTSISSAEWSRLLADLKVPLKLGQAAAAGGACADPLAPRTYAALYAMAMLFDKAVVAGVLATERRPNSLTRSIGQQLRQSGLLAALPRLLEAAAAALDASGQLHVSDAADMTQTLCRVISRAFMDPRAQQEAVSREVLDVVRAHLVAQLLLELLNNCLSIWPQQVDKAAVSVPALRLCAAAFQHCSGCADTLPAAAPAPTVLGRLTAPAWEVARALCLEQRAEQQVAVGLSVLRSPDALRAFCMLLMTAVLAHGAGGVAGQAGPRSTPNAAAAVGSSSSRRTHVVGDIWSEASVAASQAAWQAACAHESSLSTAQQQALRELGCSGRGLMWLAGHALAPLMTRGADISGVLNTMGLMLPHGSTSAVQNQDSPTLNQPQQIRQLAVALSQLQPGDCLPPCGSPLLPCAALLWLMPAVLLEWAQSLPTDEPQLASMLYRSSSMLGPCLMQIWAQQLFWWQAESLFAEAASAAGQLGEEQALLQAVRASANQALRMTFASLQGFEQQPAAQPVVRKYVAASKAACKLGSCWDPPASCLALLLQLSSSTGARILACIQDAPAGPSSSSSSSSGSGSGSRASKGAERVGRSFKAATGDPPLDVSLQTLSHGQASLMQICGLCLQNLAYRSSRPAAAGRLASGSSYAQGALQDSADAHDSRACDSDSLASLCSALQQTLPQLAGLVEAALRCQGGGRQVFGDAVLSSAFKFLYRACCPGPFTAARLQPGSSALKALCGVALTLVKLAGTALGGDGPPGLDMQTATSSLRVDMDVTSLVLQAACADASSSGGAAAGSSGSSDGVGDSTSTRGSSSSSNRHGVASVLLGNNLFSGSWDAATLSRLSTVAAASSTTTSLGPGTAAVEMVPWLVTFGRCCLQHAASLQQLPQAGRVGLDTEQPQAVKDVCHVLPGWLQRDSVSAQLSAAGYNTARLLELLQQTAQTQQQQGVLNSVQQLQDLGLALTSLPFDTGCNNPGCSVLDELSEQRLVVGTARLCGGCRVARYCCRACQVAAWKLHKPACKAMAAARAAGSLVESAER